jgi:hypothetical protein
MSLLHGSEGRQAFHGGRWSGGKWICKLAANNLDPQILSAVVKSTEYPRRGPAARSAGVTPQCANP